MFNSDYLCFLAVFFSGYRGEEHSKLSAELENLPNIASRKSYIQRITEITKNSRKQDADIDRILQETRQLQIESNSIQDRLHRTYTVVDETIFRYCLNAFDLRVSPRILYYQRQIWCLSFMLWNKWIYNKKTKKTKAMNWFQPVLRLGNLSRHPSIMQVLEKKSSES